MRAVTKAEGLVISSTARMPDRDAEWLHRGGDKLLQQLLQAAGLMSPGLIWIAIIIDRSRSIKEPLVVRPGHRRHTLQIQHRPKSSNFSWTIELSVPAMVNREDALNRLQEAAKAWNEELKYKSVDQIDTTIIKLPIHTPSATPTQQVKSGIVIPSSRVAEFLADDDQVQLLLQAVSTVNKDAQAVPPNANKPEVFCWGVAAELGKADPRSVMLLHAVLQELTKKGLVRLQENGAYEVVPPAAKPVLNGHHNMPTTPVAPPVTQVSQPKVAASASAPTSMSTPEPVEVQQDDDAEILTTQEAIAPSPTLTAVEMMELANAAQKLSQNYAKQEPLRVQLAKLAEEEKTIMQTLKPAIRERMLALLGVK